VTAPFIPPPRPRWTGRLRGVVTERLGLKAIALLLALLLWLVVTARRPTESYVRVRIAPSLDSSLVLLDGTSEVRALVAGRAADLVKLAASPPVVRRSVGGDVPDTLVLDVTPADVHLPTELVDAVRVLDVQPRSVTHRFETRATRRVPLVNDGRVVVRSDSGVPASGEVVFEPQAVRVTGPRRLVRRLRGIRPFSLSIATRDTMPHVADLDTTGIGVQVQPAQVKVQLRGVTASVPIPQADSDVMARP
jgi:YbbR domain-containing protein